MVRKNIKNKDIVIDPILEKYKNISIYKNTIDFNHIWYQYYWWVIAIIGLSIILFFLIIILYKLNEAGNEQNGYQITK